MEFDNADSMIRAIQANRGIGIVPEAAVRRETATGSLASRRLSRAADDAPAGHHLPTFRTPQSSRQRIRLTAAGSPAGLGNQKDEIRRREADRGYGDNECAGPALRLLPDRTAGFDARPAGATRHLPTNDLDEPRVLR